jgi:hypothetical protein
VVLEGLEQRVGEETARVAVLAEPFVKRVEDGENARLRTVGPSRRLRLEPSSRPNLLVMVEDGDNKIIVRGEMPVERRLRNAGFGDDPVDAVRSRAS